MACKVCTNAKRTEIEEKLLARSLGELSVTIESISKEYNIPVMDLQIHSIMHKTAPVDESTERADSLVTAIKSKEANYLLTSIIEYQKTQVEIGALIRTAVKPDDDGRPGFYKINKPISDLYIGLGGEIRSAVDSLVRMNASVNGEDVSGVKALAELAMAIRGSKSDV